MAVFRTLASQLANQGEQQINNLWPGHFVTGKVYEETRKKYSTIMLMLMKADRGKATG